MSGQFKERCLQSDCRFVLSQKKPRVVASRDSMGRSVSSVSVVIIFLLAVCFSNGCADQKKQAKGLVQSALQHRDAARYADAVQNLNRAIALDPRLSEAWYLRGLSHAALKHQKESIADLTTAVRLNPKWAEAWLALGIVQRASGENSLAIKSFSEALRQNSNLTAAWFDRACAYSELGDAQSEVRDLEAVLKLDPDHRKALMKHASLIMEVRPNDAIEDVARIINVDRLNAEAWYLRGVAWHRTGDLNAKASSLGV